MAATKMFPTLPAAARFTARAGGYPCHVMPVEGRRTQAHMHAPERYTYTKAPARDAAEWVVFYSDRTPAAVLQLQSDGTVIMNRVRGLDRVQFLGNVCVNKKAALAAI